MSDHKQELIQSTNDVFDGACLKYRRKSLNWFFDKEDLLIVVGYSKNSWGGEYYRPQVVFFLKNISTFKSLPGLCHEKIAADWSLTVGDTEKLGLKKTLDFGDPSLPLPEKLKHLQQYLKQYILPVLANVNNQSDLIQWIQDERKKGWTISVVFPEARRLGLKN